MDAAVTSLRTDDLGWSEVDQAELLQGIEEGADRLNGLVGNILDMSRLQTGTVTPIIRETDVDEAIPMALGGVPEGRVDLDIPETLPMVAVDRGPMERSVANIVENAVKHSPHGTQSWLGERHRQTGWKCASWTAAGASPTRPRTASSNPSSTRHRSRPRAGGGPRLRRSHRWHLQAEDTPGGGLTMVLSVPMAAAAHRPPPEADVPVPATS